MATAQEIALLDLSAFLGAIGTVKTFVVAKYSCLGQEYRVYVDTVDGSSGAKKVSVHRAVKSIVGKGFSLPQDTRFYLTSAYAAQNRAFHFDEKCGSVAWITLGTTALLGGSGNGISAQDTPGFDSCTKIAIHELGHSLHALKVGVEGFYKPDRGDLWKGTVANATTEVSAYAGNSKKEFVAEVFLGAIIGRKYNNAIRGSYHELQGPEVDGLL